MAADLHTHTNASNDSPLTFHERVQTTQDAGIDTVAITDHVAVHEELTEREFDEDGLRIVSGVELNCTTHGTRIDILGYFIDPAEMRPWTDVRSVKDCQSLTPSDIIGHIHGAGGAAVLAHPGRYDTDIAALVDDLVASGLDGIEIEYPYDAYTFISRETPTMPTTPVEEIDSIGTAHSLLRTGGSDCHGGDKTYSGLVTIGPDRVDRLRSASKNYQ